MKPLDPDSETAVEYVARLEAEVNRLILAVTKMSHMDCQCGEDAMKMREIATSAALWHRPDSMWWHSRTDGPPQS